jgi:hypothetical protein
MIINAAVLCVDTRTHARTTHTTHNTTQVLCRDGAVSIRGVHRLHAI